MIYIINKSVLKKKSSSRNLHDKGGEVLCVQLSGRGRSAKTLQSFHLIFVGNPQELRIGGRFAQLAGVEEVEELFKGARVDIFNIDTMATRLFHIGAEHGGEDGAPGGHNGPMGLKYSPADGKLGVAQLAFDDGRPKLLCHPRVHRSIAILVHRLDDI